MSIEKLNSNRATAARPLTATDRARLEVLANALGEKRAANVLCVSHLSFVRALHGHDVRFPTAAAIREGLAQLATLGRVTGERDE